MDKILKEKKFHNERFQNDDEIRVNAKKFYSINKNSNNLYSSKILSQSLNKRILELGCGVENNAQKYLESSSSYTGIDISEEAIKIASATSLEKTNYFVMNAEEMNFDDNSFDIVIGEGIIHHLDIKKVYIELSRVLEENGHAIFIEPLGHNAFINLYRKLTPTMRTEDEHPLMIDDLKLLNKYFSNVDLYYFSLLTILAVPFRNSFLFNCIHNILSNIDRILFHIPFIRKNAWIVLIHVNSPIK